MNFTLRSASSSFNQENERLTRKRPTTTTNTTATTFNRFLSFNENKSSSAENRRRSFQSTPNLIELLEEDEDNIDDNQALCHECNTCTKVFASEYGLNHHINMHHPNQSILCSICNLTFPSHRSLKTHQQRRHSTIQTKGNITTPSLPNYTSISSYLVLGFSSKQFPIMAKDACEQQRLPLGCFSSKLYQCHLCLISFPCSRTLKYHFLTEHEQYEYKICQTILSELLEKVEFNLRTVDNNEMKTIEFELAQQASQFGLINKQLSTKFSSNKTKQNHLIYPICQHEKRTCANLCLQYLSSYSKLIHNYSYTIPTVPKGNPFAQGSIVSIIPMTNHIHVMNSSSLNETNGSNESTNGRQKRKNIKHTDNSFSPRWRKRMLASITTIDTKSNRTNSNNKTNVEKQQSEQMNKMNDTKSLSIEQNSSIQKKILPKDNYIRSSSISSNSSTSTRSSMTKSSSSTTNLISQRSSKRSLSPSIITSSEKRRRAREQNRRNPSTNIVRIDDNDIEQENDDEDDVHDGGNNNNDDDDDDDIIPIKCESTKQRQASSGSIEYVHILNNDQQLNNIENIKSKSKVNDEEIIICHSPPSVKKVLPTTNKTNSKSNGARKSNVQQALNNDEHVRVRCKICGEILEGRSRFSKHVINMHSHLLKKNITDPKQQQQQQTAIVR